MISVNSLSNTENKDSFKILMKEASISEITFLLLRDAIQKKIAEKETLVHTEGRGVKKYPFLAHQKGDIFLWGDGSKTCCHMSHVQFCVSVSSQFVAVFDALHHENFLYHMIKEFT